MKCPRMTGQILGRNPNKEDKMNSTRKTATVLSIVLLFCAMSSGCAVNFYKQNPRSKQKINALEDKISDLERAKMELQKKLSRQIENKEVSLRMDDKGLVIVLSNSILFDSGKDTLKNNAYPVLDKVINVIKKEIPEQSIGIEGHTDNVPIKHSGWKSNWELSTARATTVLHYMESKGIAPGRLSATGYGEYQPVASNATAAGRAKNRRVEIVILPEFVEKKADVVK
ncbi:MAG: OmpA family protein [Candidatus Omnitrophica bacterium]|nr:OmpA family protein [Candidatus Omnitrophota bacterium]